MMFEMCNDVGDVIDGEACRPCIILQLLFRFSYQVATAFKVFIFDLNRLGKFNDKLCDQTTCLLHALFCSPVIMKVGWDFSNADLNMLKAAARGK